MFNFYRVAFVGLYDVSSSLSAALMLERWQNVNISTIFNPGKDCKYGVMSENWEVGFCFAVPVFCGQPKWCSGNLRSAPLILLLFHNKWKFYRIFQDSLSKLLTIFVKLAFKMQFKQWGEAIELFFSAKPLLASVQ